MLHITSQLPFLHPTMFSRVISRQSIGRFFSYKTEVFNDNFLERKGTKVLPLMGFVVEQQKHIDRLQNQIHEIKQQRMTLDTKLALQEEDNLILKATVKHQKERLDKIELLLESYFVKPNE